jgi:hypothetical protein
MSELLLGGAGRHRSPATMPGFCVGHAPGNKGLRYPADPPKLEEIVTVMRAAGDRSHGRRLRGVIAILCRSGLRIQEALALTAGAVGASRSNGQPSQRLLTSPTTRRQDSDRSGCCSTTTPKVCTATFTGKANITAVNRSTGAAFSLGGNYQFQVDVTDNGEPGSSNTPTPDTYALRVWNTGGTYYQLGDPKAQLKLEGGNIQVRP